jgi:hypothetical protein
MDIMLSKESQIEIISEIIYEHLKGKHKDRIAKELAEQIIDALDLQEPPTWYVHG